MKLLSTANPKTQKGVRHGYLSFVLHLYPGKTCPKASNGCLHACLNTAGRGGLFKRGHDTNHIQLARIRKTELFYNDRDTFLSMLHDDIKKGIKQAQKLGLIPCFRLNGTSDLPFEKYGIIQEFSNYQFYDYTKVLNRKRLDNYHLTFSRSESNAQDVKKAIEQGYNVASVFHALPNSYLDLPVINGDSHDLRFLDQRQVIVGLTAKGRAKKDTSGFVL